MLTFMSAGWLKILRIYIIDQIEPHGKRVAWRNASHPLFDIDALLHNAEGLVSYLLAVWVWTRSLQGRALTMQVQLVAEAFSQSTVRLPELAKYPQSVPYSMTVKRLQLPIAERRAAFLLANSCSERPT